jgi:hypothetical protein
MEHYKLNPRAYFNANIDLCLKYTRGEITKGSYLKMKKALKNFEPEIAGAGLPIRS